jgi:predicted GTPase
MMFLAVIQITADPEKSAAGVVEQVINCYEIIQQILIAEQASAFQIEKLLEALKK